MTAQARLAKLIDEPELRDSALAQLCRDLITDQQRLHQRLERISRISDRYQADLRRSNEELATTNERLSAALREVRTLGGFIPICSCCKKVRNDGGYWDDVETYLAEHSDAVFSQGRCPSCATDAGASRQPPVAARDGEDPAELERLERILAREEWAGHPLRDEYTRLSTDYQKLGRRLYKISRISDGFQTQMKEFNLALGRVSRTDALTGLANRRALLECLDQYAADAVDGPGFAVAMIDVDNFKRINDSFGHASGDSVLRSLAALLAATVHDGGLVGRWGGEEFLLVLDGKHAANIAAVCEMVRAETEAMQIASGGRSIRVTVSIGIAVHDRSLSFEDTLRDADRALYAAKACGRNRVISLDEL
jgi:diguanylate cyclase (GGDEF)-like protein